MESRAPAAEPSSKRPRSPSGDFPPIASKVPKTHSNHLQINYLARQYPDNLPLVSVDDSMPAIIHLIGEYDGVLHRHESIAGNLGACPLGPILIKRFERLFDGPPRVLKSHGKDSPNITWLDVVEFAKNKPEQFNLEKSRNGVRVCQFYTKQCRVEISEEDFVLIASGMPQKMIPPQPIIEDEEKELGALEILEKNLQQITQIADQVSARARQLNHRLKNRRTAIVSRRENDLALHSQQARSISPSWRDANGNGQNPLNGNGPSNPTGFVAVNANRPGADPAADESLSSQFMFSHSNTENVTIINGTSIKGASPTTRMELMKKFFTTADRQARGYEDPPVSGTGSGTGSGIGTGPGPGPGPGPGSGQISRPSSRPRPPRVSDAADLSALYNPTPATVAIPNTPSSLLPPPKSNHQEKDDGGPYKLEMIARMEELQRGDRILPPCDRCRRLHMDCLKNLTACMGCTKKHAKCSWKDVKEEELQESRMAQAHDDITPTGSPFGLAAVPASVPTPASFGPPEQYERPCEREPEHSSSFNARRESAPTAGPQGPGTPLGRELSPRRAVSEIHGSAMTNHDRRVSMNRHSDPAPDDDDPGANQRLMQAILDTVDHHARATATGQEKDSAMRHETERERQPRERAKEEERQIQAHVDEILRERERKLVRA